MEPLSAFRRACNTRAEETWSWLSSWVCVGDSTSLLLRDAHLLLGVEAIADFIVEDTFDYWGHFPKRDTGEYVIFSYDQSGGKCRLISHLRGLLCNFLIDGGLIGTCLAPENAISGKRVRIPTDRWRAVDLNFENSQISAAGKIVGVDVMIERPIVQQSRATPPAQADVEREVQNIAKEMNILPPRSETVRRVKEKLPAATESQVRAAMEKAPRRPAHRPKNSGN